MLLGEPLFVKARFVGDYARANFGSARSQPTELRCKPIESLSHRIRVSAYTMTPVYSGPHCVASQLTKYHV